MAFLYEHGRHGCCDIRHTAGRGFDGRRCSGDLRSRRRSRRLLSSGVGQAARRAESDRSRQLARDTVYALGDEAAAFEAFYIETWQENAGPQGRASRRATEDARTCRLGIGAPRRLLSRLRWSPESLRGDPHSLVPFDNNHAERSIRPAVIIRKNSYGNRSQRGADCQAVFMSIFRTLKQRGHDPIRAVIEALNEYITTGKLSPLPPAKSAADG